MKDSETETVTTMNGGRYGVSLGGAITGLGADVSITDDPIKAQDCYSEAERERVYRTFTETTSTRLNNPATARRIVTMQRLHEDDLAGRLLAKGGWPHLCIPAVAPEGRIYNIGLKSEDIHIVKPGDLMHPHRLSKSFLDEQRREMGSAAFSAQYLQDPFPADGEMIKRDWVKRFTGSLDSKGYDHVIQSWDTAVKTGARHDYSACLTFGIRGREIHVIDAVRKKLDFHKLQTFAVEHAGAWGAQTVLIEDANLGPALVNHLRKSTHLAAIPITPKGPKEIRVARAAAQIEAGRLFLPENAPWSATLEKEMFAFPNARNDDLVDALSQFLNWIVANHKQEIQARVTTIGAGGSEIQYRDKYFERTGIPIF